MAPPAGRQRWHVWLSKMTRVPVRKLQGDLLGLLAGFAIERPVRRQSRKGTAQLDNRETYLSCRAVQVLLDRGPSPMPPPEPYSRRARIQELHFPARSARRAPGSGLRSPASPSQGPSVSEFAGRG